MRKDSKSELNVLAQEIAEAAGIEIRQILKEFLEELKEVPLVKQSSQGKTKLSINEVSMDESIIPIDIAIDVESTNLESAVIKQKVVDKDLGKSKSKLAGLLKKRNKTYEKRLK